MINARNRTKGIVAIVMVAVTTVLSAGVVLSQEDGENREGRSWGQRGGHGPGSGFGDPSRMVKRLAKHLDLSETQEQSLNNIVDAAKPEFESMRERARANFTAMRNLETTDPDYSAKLSNLAIENGELVTEGTLLVGRIRAEVNAELTDEQRATLEARLQERHKRGRRGQRRGGNDGDNS